LDRSTPLTTLHMPTHYLAIKVVFKSKSEVYATNENQSQLGGEH